MDLNLLSTLKGSLLEGFFPKGWDLAAFDSICSRPPAEASAREPWWHECFSPVRCETLADFDTYMGHEIALRIKLAAEAGPKICLFLLVGLMGGYRWGVVFF